jgi:hypothetical protein
MALDLPALFSGISVIPTAMVEGKTTRIEILTAAPAVLSGTFLERDLRIASDQAPSTPVFFRNRLATVAAMSAPGRRPFAAASFS